jgi:hypothetical protein
MDVLRGNVLDASGHEKESKDDCHENNRSVDPATDAGLGSRLVSTRSQM